MTGSRPRRRAAGTRPPSTSPTPSAARWWRSGTPPTAISPPILSERVGAEFAGRISGIARFGVFVKLDETGADGLVPMRALGHEFFHLDRDARTLMGADTGAGHRAWPAGRGAAGRGGAGHRRPDAGAYVGRGRGDAPPAGRGRGRPPRRKEAARQGQGGEGPQGHPQAPPRAARRAPRRRRRRTRPPQPSCRRWLSKKLSVRSHASAPPPRRSGASCRCGSRGSRPGRSARRTSCRFAISAAS